MLARASSRSVRLFSTPASPIRNAVAPFQSRPYAKSNKTRKPFEYRAPSSASPSSRTSPAAQKPSEPAAGSVSQPASDSVASSNPPDASRLNDEYDCAANADLKTLPTAKDLGSNAQHTATSQSKSPSDYSGLQDEFGTSAPSDDNTAPQFTSSSAIDPAETRRREKGQSPTQPLPDLTQGIPSTLDSELASTSTKSDSTSLNLTEDPAAPGEQPGGQRGGDLPKTAYISSFERRRNRWANWFYASFLSTTLIGTVYLGRNWDTEEEERKHPDVPSGWGFGLFYNRAMARLHDLLDYYNEPAFPKLLPNTDPAWERPYTLVLSLEDLLVHSEWSREHGWRTAKRPGVDYFLRYLSQYYELVIFTSVPSMIGHPIVTKLDPYRIVMWPLFREATRYRNGEYIKDLAFLNRDLKKIIMFDTVPAHAKLQPENAIITPKWKGNLQDKELVSYIPFLEYVASMEIGDTREVLKSFEGKHIPSEFARREAISRERFQQQLAEERAKRPRRSIGSLGSMLGVKPQVTGPDGIQQSLSEGFEQGKTFQDQVRERGQKQYEMLEKEIRDNGEKWLKEMQEEEKKMNDEAMKGMKSSITGVFPFGGGSGKTS